MANPSAVPAPLALIPYAERFLDGRRVVIFGDATAGLAEEAAERGARLVHVVDLDPARVAEAVATAPRGLSFAVLRDGGDGALRDGAFDTCLIPDLAIFGDPRALLAQARRLLASNGVVIAATPRVEGRRGESLRGKGGPLNYYDFYDVLARQFAAVTMAGQVPFQGYALVNFALEGDPEVTVDASLIDAVDREPVAYVALASDRMDEVKASAGNIATAAAPFGSPAFKIGTAAAQLTSAVELPDAREKFARLSDAIITYMDGLHLTPPEGVHIASCAATGNQWLQQGDSIANPYDGSSAPACGSLR